LLFLLCHWHHLAKLRMHTDDTLEVMEGVTVRLANHIHAFTTTTCTAFPTKELQHEAESCRRRTTCDSVHKKAGSHATDSHRPKTFNLQTYKLHALRHY
ncbi:hypothetical protein PAXINDRAFT_36528, partial [Paxillus involutus ATCC 200175]